MNIPTRKLFLTAFIILLIEFSNLYGTTLNNSEKFLSYKDISRSIEFLEDKNRSITIDDVSKKDFKWKSVEGNKVSFGWTDSQYWFRFTIKENFPEKNVYIEIDNPLLDFVELFIPAANGSFTEKKGGDNIASKEKEIHDRTILFLDKSPLTGYNYYLKVRTSGLLHFRLSLMSDRGLLAKKNNELPLYWFFYGLIITLVLYNTVIYFFAKQRAYLYYTLFLIFAFLWHFNDSGFSALYFFPDSPRLQNQSLLFYIAMVYFWLTQYIIELVDEKEKFPAAYIFLKYTIQLPCLVIASLTPFLGHAILLKTIYAFQLYLIISLAFIGIYQAVIEKSRETRILILAFLPLIFAIPAFLLSNMGKLPSNLFFKWLPAIGISLTFIILSIALADKITLMARAVRKAERKYRSLVESSNDIIFALDKNYKFISINRAFAKHLSFNVENVLGQSFLDFIQDRSNPQVHFARDLIKEYLNELIEKKGELNFKADFKTAIADEPLELSVKIEYIEEEYEEAQILGKASILADDIIIQYLKTEIHTYEIENYLNLAELMSQRLTKNLIKVMNISKLAGLRISLREILVNAIEHGNLNIRFDEKTRALSSGSYFKFIQERQKIPAYMNRKIFIDYSIDSEHVQYTITDEGNGFDHKNIEKIINSDPGDSSLEHGRGIMMAKIIFDEVIYNEKGNSVTLIKHFINSESAV